MPLVKKWDGTGHYFDIFVKSFSRKKFQISLEFEKD